jgi:hypothetical protein
MQPPPLPASNPAGDEEVITDRSYPPEITVSVIPNKKFDICISPDSVMVSRFLVIIIVFLLIGPVAAFDPFQEKPKTQWGFRDFYSAAQQAGHDQEYYTDPGRGNDPAKAAEADQNALQNYLKAEEIVATEPDDSPDKWAFISRINGQKSEIYSRQGKTAEATKAKETMGAATRKYEDLMKNDTSFDVLCLIATATFNSPLSPQVQQLRDFRENTIYSTRSGTQFMTAFNAWYYSFSPAVAKFINDHPATKAPMQVVLTPLLGILTLAQMSYSLVSFNPEIAVVVSGLVAGTLIGAVYAFPVLLALLFGIRKFRPGTLASGIVTIPGGLAVTGLILLAIGGLVSADQVLLVGSTFFIVGLVFMTGLFLSWVCLNRLQLRSAPENSG